MKRLFLWLFNKFDKVFSEGNMQANAIAHDVMTRFSELSPSFISNIAILAKRMPSEAAIVVVHNPHNDLYLAVHRNNEPNDWGFSGGKLEPGESAINGAIRELEEETPYTALEKNVKYFDTRPDGMTHVHVFVIDYKNLAIHTGECEQNYGWVPLTELIRPESSFGDFNKNLIADLYAYNWSQYTGVLQ